MKTLFNTPVQLPVAWMPLSVETAKILLEQQYRSFPPHNRYPNYPVLHRSNKERVAFDPIKQTPLGHISKICSKGTLRANPRFGVDTKRAIHIKQI
jgi:hypothetical protein